MPLSNTYVLQYLVQNTDSTNQPICWRELEAGGFWAEISGVRVEVTQAYSSTGTRVCVTFSSGVEQIAITEPLNASFFGRKYKDEDERQLVELMRTLNRRIAKQCVRRQMRLLDPPEELRQQIFRRLVFGAET